MQFWQSISYVALQPSSSEYYQDKDRSYLLKIKLCRFRLFLPFWYPLFTFLAWHSLITSIHDWQPLREIASLYSTRTTHDAWNISYLAKCMISFSQNVHDIYNRFVSVILIFLWRTHYIFPSRFILGCIKVHNTWHFIENDIFHAV